MDFVDAVIVVFPAFVVVDVVVIVVVVWLQMILL